MTQMKNVMRNAYQAARPSMLRFLENLSREQKEDTRQVSTVVKRTGWDHQPQVRIIRVPSYMSSLEKKSPIGEYFETLSLFSETSLEYTGH